MTLRGQGGGEGVGGRGILKSTIIKLSLKQGYDSSGGRGRGSGGQISYKTGHFIELVGNAYSMNSTRTIYCIYVVHILGVADRISIDFRRLNPNTDPWGQRQNDPQKLKKKKWRNFMFWCAGCMYFIRIIPVWDSWREQRLDPDTIPRQWVPKIRLWMRIQNRNTGYLSTKERIGTCNREPTVTFKNFTGQLCFMFWYK